MPMPPQQVLFGRQQKEASERKTAAMNAARDALAGVGQKAKRGEHGEHDGDVSPNKPLQMLQVCDLVGLRVVFCCVVCRACVLRWFVGFRGRSVVSSVREQAACCLSVCLSLPLGSVYV